MASFYRKNLILKLINSLHSQQLYSKLGLGVERIIRKRTREGKDVEGVPFVEYSKGYVKKKEAAGFADAHAVNLTFSKVHGMLSKMTHEVANDLESVSVFFDDQEKEQLALYHHKLGAGRGKVIRKFFDVELQTEKDQLADIYVLEVKKIIKNLG